MVGQLEYVDGLICTVLAFYTLVCLMLINIIAGLKHHIHIKEIEYGKENIYIGFVDCLFN